MYILFMYYYSSTFYFLLCTFNLVRELCYMNVLVIYLNVQTNDTSHTWKGEGHNIYRCIDLAGDNSETQIGLT